MNAMGEQDKRISEAKDTLETISTWINNCDTKASTILALLGIILTLVFTNDGIKLAYIIVQKAVQSKTFSDIFYLLVWGCTFLTLLYGLYSLISVLIGRINRKIYKQQGLTIDSRIFFGAISDNATYEEFKQKALDASEESYINDLLSQIYINSKIANQKFKNYNRGLKIAIIGFVLFIIMFLLGVYIYI